MWTSNLCWHCIGACSQRKKTLDDRSEECLLIVYGSGNIYRLLTKKTRKIIIARDVKFDESFLGFGHFRNKVELLYINDDDDDKEKKDAQAPIETCIQDSKITSKGAENVSSIEIKATCQEGRRGKERFQRR